MKPFETVALRFDGERIWALDQTALPLKENWIDVTDPPDLIAAIQKLGIRGAPLIGVAAAACLGQYHPSGRDFVAVATRVRAVRPTAVNLAWAVDRLLKAHHEKRDVCDEAFRIVEEDRLLCERIAEKGAALLQDGMTVITHCNAGALATGGVGTALGVISRAHRQGKRIHVFVDETRPLLQGARLTTWELKRAGIPYTLICDNMAASVMRTLRIGLAIVGADRIAMNGDFANKIGTYGLAVNCQYHKVPLVVAAPASTVDRYCPNGEAIPIELRPGDEIRPLEPCWNPAFDVTPAEMVHRFVLDSGVYSPQEYRDFIRRE
ncbi:MAG: S-methyl-5-thioribose-1-phosphate isomerase [Deltaproteobacteria bacterium]|nr:S-methyl-5-thioribose-1-phosphate isomerase [Deltaproteobacteria bacterium]MBI3294235.1 S-methyl-5-thioribose-1-phosphate isomerase [Deltaproteobacteria bacterium]